MTEFDTAVFDALEPEEFAALVTTASRGQLEEVMAGPRRREILDAIFHQLPTRFRADRAGATNAVVQWNITGGAEGATDVYDVAIADGACSVSGPSGTEPKVTFTLAGPDFLTLITGSANPMTMFMTGKLKAKGDLGLAANVANLFDLPKS